MDFGGLAYSGSSWELIFGFLSVQNASWVSILPTKPAEKVWATSKNIFGGLYKYREEPQMNFWETFQNFKMQILRHFLPFFRSVKTQNGQFLVGNMMLWWILALDEDKLPIWALE